MKVEGAEPQYNRRTFLKIFKALVKKKKAKYTVLGVAASHRKSLKPHWPTALKYALRVLKKRQGIDYVLLFEESAKGHEHAHVILTKKVGRYDFSKVVNGDLNDLRDLYFRKLYRLVTEEKAGDMEWKEVAKVLKIDHAKRMIQPITFYVTPKKDKIPAGRGSGFIDYLLDKRETIERGTVISYGLLKLRRGKK